MRIDDRKVPSEVRGFINALEVRLADLEREYSGIQEDLYHLTNLARFLEEERAGIERLLEVERERLGGERHIPFIVYDEAPAAWSGVRGPGKPTLADAAFLALERIGRAAHHSEILEGIKGLEIQPEAQLKSSNLLSAMSRDRRFIRVENAPVRGIYAVSGWPREKMLFPRERWELMKIDKELEHNNDWMRTVSQTLEVLEEAIGQASEGQVEGAVQTLQRAELAIRLDSDNQNPQAVVEELTAVRETGQRLLERTRDKVRRLEMKKNALLQALEGGVR